MNTGHNNAAAIAVDIAKGWRPNYYLTNMAMSYFQAPGMNVAPSIFPILPDLFFVEDIVASSTCKHWKLLYLQQRRDRERPGKEKA